MSEVATAPVPASHPKKSPKKKASKPKKAASHPKYSDMISKAITSLNEHGGSSRQALLKYILANYKVDPEAAKVNLNLALRAGVKNGTLKQSKGSSAFGSFRIRDKAKKTKKTAKPKAAKTKPSAKKMKKPKPPGVVKSLKTDKKPKVKKPAAATKTMPKKAKVLKKAKKPSAAAKKAKAPKNAKKPAPAAKTKSKKAKSTRRPRMQRSEEEMRQMTPR